MRPALLLVFATLIGVLAFWVVFSDDAGRTARHAAPATEPLANELDSTTRSGDAEVAETAQVFLRGRVLGPGGHPVHKAEISRLYPKPIDVVFTEKDGRYALPLLRTGRHSIEAAYGMELSPQKVVIEIPDAGEPDELDFRLKTFGYMFGRVACRGEPVDQADVDLVQDGEVLVETVSVEGLFVIDEEPPRDVDLELRVRHHDVFLESPKKLRYEFKGQQIGDVQLTAYSRIEVAATLRDGKDAAVGFVVVLDPGEHAGSRRLRQTMELRGNAEYPDRMRLKKGHYRVAVEFGEWVVVRTIELKHQATTKIELREPRPARYRSRLVDHHGRALRARLCVPDYGSGPTTECDRSGRFEFKLRHGGLWWVEIAALEHDGVWFDLVSRLGFAIDTDAVEDPVVIRLDGHLLISRLPESEELELRRVTEDRERTVWTARHGWAGNGVYLSPQLETGRYLLRFKDTDWKSRKPPRERMIEIGDDLVFVDASQ